MRATYIFEGTLLMINQPPQDAQPLQRESQFKWPTQRPQSPARHSTLLPLFPEVDYSQLPDVQWPRPAIPRNMQKKRGKLRRTPLAPLRKQRKPRRKKLRRLLVILSILTILSGLMCSQLNGQLGAQFADIMRSVLGPTVTAQIESWFLGVSDTAHHIQYQLSGQQVTAPWTIPHTHKVTPSSSTLTTMPLVPIKPFISPSLSGEGTWTTDGLPAPTAKLPPLVARTFIRPDPNRPYGIVTLLQFDTRFLALHMIAGTTQPGGPRGVYGPGRITASDLKNNLLFAAFNGGFKYADGQYGMYVNGTTYVPPQNGAATIAITKEGQVILGAWGKDPRLTSGNTDLAAWRQNAALLIDNGVINPLTNDGVAWGGTILNRAYTWRSGIGITASGSLIYAAGNAVSALTLGETLKAAGAVMAMQTDINPNWVRAFLYERNASGSLQITKLNPSMQGSGTEYLYGTDRDFFYFTRILPAPKRTG
jgi:hypothetical protein